MKAHFLNTTVRFKLAVNCLALRLIKPLMAVTLVLLFSSHSFAIELDSPLPALNIKEAGEIVINEKGKAKFISWSSSNLISSISLLQVLKASQEAADINKVYLDKFGERFNDNNKVDSATIVVSNNIPSLLGGFVKKELKKNKKAHPHAIMINDKKGITRSAWELPETQAIMMLVDSKGVVRKYHEGKLADSEHQNWNSAIDELLQEQE